MVDVKMNFRNKYADTLCPVCKTVGVEDSQEHVMECVQLLNNKNILVNREIKYSHIFDSVSGSRLLQLGCLIVCGMRERKS